MVGTLFASVSESYLNNLRHTITSKKSEKFYSVRTFFSGLTSLLIIVLLLFLSVFAVSASPVVEEEWEKTYGGESGDIFYSVGTTKGGYVAVGYKTTRITSDRDMWLVITDSRGNILKDKIYGGNEYDVGYSILPTESGYLIAGYTSSNNDNDFWLVSVDTLGNEKWNRTYGGDKNDIAYSIRGTRDGGFVLIGSTYSFGVNGDIWLIKVNSTGFEEWNRTYGGTNNEVGYGVIELSDGYILAGSTKTIGLGGNDMWLVKTNLLGEEEWNKRFGGPNDDSATSVIQAEDGGFLLAGYTSSYGEGGQEIWLVRTDSQGNEVWSKRFGGPNDDSATSVVQTDDGGFIVSGLTRSYGANGNVLLIKTNQYGIVEWSKLLGGTSWDIINNIELTLDGEIVLAGGTQSFGDKGIQGWLIKMKTASVLTSSPLSPSTLPPAPTGTEEVNASSGDGILNNLTQTPLLQNNESIKPPSSSDSGLDIPGFEIALGAIAMFTAIILRRPKR